MRGCVFVEIFEIFIYISRFHRDRLCWQTVEQQFIAALVIALVVVPHFKKILQVNQH